MSKGALIIFLKDLRESLRNRRTLVRMLLFPLLILPVGGHYLLSFTGKHREDLNKTVLDYAVAGGQSLPELVRLYEEDPGFHRVNVPEDKVEEAVRSRQIKFALRIPPNAGSALKAGQGVSIDFIYYQGDPGEVVVKDRGIAPLQDFNVKQRDWRLLFMGVAREEDRAKLLDPVTYVAVNEASDRERIGFGLGGIVAYLFLAVCLMGSSFAAVDLVAGEKEKGTLEILIMLPIARRQIVLGKYLLIFLYGLAYATLSAISLTAWLVYETTHASGAVRDVITQISPAEIFLLWTVLVPVTAMFSAVVLAISVYARSYREATTMIGFANVLQSMLVMIAFTPGVNLDRVWSNIPVANVSLMIRELIRGRLDDDLVVASIFATTLAIGVALLLFSTAWFRREAIIYRD